MQMLGKRNICMLFLPHSHIDEQKEHRVTVCEKFVVAWWRSPLKGDFRIPRMSRT
jgi:hypothetical protein